MIYLWRALPYNRHPKEEIKTEGTRLVDAKVIWEVKKTVSYSQFIYNETVELLYTW